MLLKLSKHAIKTEQACYKCKLKIRKKLPNQMNFSYKNEQFCIKNSCFLQKKTDFSCVIQLFVVPLQSEMVKRLFAS